MSHTTSASSPRKGLVVLVLLGLVSLFADMTYEGARSVLGPYTELLGGTAIIAGSLAIGDLLGYLTRAATGGLLQRLKSTRAYWGLIYAGYIINLGAVPLLAYAGRWQEALLLVVLERIGKGIRAPPRDIILGEVSKRLGTARGYALHEIMDQAGAVAGPLVVAVAISMEGIRRAFLILALPALAAIATLIAASLLYPTPREVLAKRRAEGSLTHIEKIGIFVVGFSIAVLPIWPVYTYKVSAEQAALMYSIAMLTDAIAAPIAGEVLERRGRSALALLPWVGLLGAVTLPFVEPYRSMEALLMLAGLWGVYMGFYEVYSRASVPVLVPEGRRAIAYGYMGLASAVGLLAAGLIYGGLMHYGILQASPLVGFILASALSFYLLRALRE